MRNDDMNTVQQQKPVIEHDELIDMRTHLTVAVLAAAQLRRTVKDMPGAARCGTYLDRALDNLVEDVRKVDALVAQAETQVPVAADRAVNAKPQRLLPRLARAPLRLVRRVAGGCCQWAQRRGLMRLTTLSAYD
jgi:hypothetical protein